MLLQWHVNFDQVKQLLVVRVDVVDVFQFQFQNLNSNRVDFQDYQNDIEFGIEMDMVVVVVVVVVFEDFVREMMNDMMQNGLGNLLEMKVHL